MKYPILAGLAVLALTGSALASGPVPSEDGSISYNTAGADMLVVHPANPQRASVADSAARSNRQMARADASAYPPGAHDQSDKDFSDTGHDGGK